MQRVQFKSAGVGPDNTPRYDLWIDNEPVRTGLEIDEVIRILAERDEAETPPLPVAEEGGGCAVQRSENARNSESPPRFPGTARREETDCHASASALARNDKTDRTPAAHRTPEDRMSWQRRDTPPHPAATPPPSPQGEGSALCREMGRYICCADCWQRPACLERCLNWPSRCGCVGKSAEEYSAAEKSLVQD